MNVIDIVLGVILLFGLVRGLMKGFFVELAALVALLAGIFGAIHFSYLLENLLAGWISWEEKYIQITAFALTFILIVVAILWLGRLLTKFSELIALGLINRLLGGIFGFLKMAFLLSIVILFFDALNQNGNIIKQKKLDSAVLYGPVKNLVPMILPSLLEKAEENKWLEEKGYFENIVP